MNGFEKYFQPTFKANFPNTRLIEGDINIPSDAFPNNMTGIIGGPLCQAWSEGGKQLGFEDPRGQLFLEYVRIVKLKRPKFFVIENVQGILEDKHKLSLAFIIRSLQSIGYSIKYQLLNAADYKIPQDRFRVFFVGIRNDLQNTFTFPTAVTDKKITLKEAIGDIIESPRFFNEETITEETQQERTMTSIREVMMQNTWHVIEFAHGMSNLLRFKHRQEMNLSIHRHQR